MAQKKKDPWGESAPNPFASTHNEVTSDPSIDWGPILDGTNRRRNMEKGMREGFVRAEDGSMVPRSFYGGGGGGRDPRWDRAGKPGYVQAEDGTWVPESFYANSSKPIEW